MPLKPPNKYKVIVHRQSEKFGSKEVEMVERRDKEMTISMKVAFNE